MVLVLEQGEPSTNTAKAEYEYDQVCFMTQSRNFESNAGGPQEVMENRRIVKKGKADRKAVGKWSLSLPDSGSPIIIKAVNNPAVERELGHNVLFCRVPEGNGAELGIQENKSQDQWNNVSVCGS
jgi:hypothetical protein